MTPKIVEMPQPLGLFAKQLFIRGSEYLEAFKALQNDERLKFPAYFLLAHSMELLLKSFLAAQGVSKKDLRERGLAHDLETLHARCVDLQMPHVENLEYFARELNDKNSIHDFRYPSNYILHIPSPKLCLEVMEPLREMLRPIVGQIALNAEIDFACDTYHLKGKKIRWSD